MLEGVLLAFIAALAGCVFTARPCALGVGGWLSDFLRMARFGSTASRNLEKCRLSGVKTVRNILMISDLLALSQRSGGHPAIAVDRVLVVEAGVAVGISGDRVPS